MLSVLGVTFFSLGDMLFDPVNFDASTVVRFFDHVDGDVSCYHEIPREQSLVSVAACDILSFDSLRAHSVLRTHPLYSVLR